MFRRCAILSGRREVFDRAYRENVTFDPGVPHQVVPPLLPMSRPVHEVVPVDVFVPGCPPSADTDFLRARANCWRARAGVKREDALRSLGVDVERARPS